MNERRLREMLRGTRPPDAGDARERARAVARAGYARRPRRAGGTRRIALPAAVALGVALVVIGIALTPPGDAVAKWVRDLVRGTSDPPRAQALARLPAAGRLLVSGAGGAWVVHPDGSRRRLGNYRDATWSPQGVYIGATRGNDLVALDPRGAVRWVLSRPVAVHDPRWAPSGVLVAYRSGDSLRVVEGDGDGDHLLARRVAPIAAAWRPGARNVVSYVTPSGSIVVRDLDAQRRLRSLRPGVAARRIEWSADGSRLLVSGPRGVRVLDGSGRIAARLDASAGTEFVDAALSPRGERIAIVVRRRSDGRHDILIASTARSVLRPRSAFRAKGPIRSVTWSPDRKVVLADWPGFDQWLFVPANRHGAVSAATGIAAHFDPGRTHPRNDVRIDGWCCP
jgi:hypothetical protein